MKLIIELLYFIFIYEKKSLNKSKIAIVSKDIAFNLNV